MFIRGHFQIMEEFISGCSMNGTTGKGIFIEMQKMVQDYNLQWSQLREVTVDGRNNMVSEEWSGGADKNSVERFANSVRSVHTLRAIFLVH